MPLVKVDPVATAPGSDFVTSRMEFESNCIGNYEGEHLTKPARSVKLRGQMDESQFELDALAIFSHPYDAELSVSGTLLRLKSLGYRNRRARYDSRGMGTRGTPNCAPKKP